MQCLTYTPLEKFVTIFLTKNLC